MESSHNLLQLQVQNASALHAIANSFVVKNGGEQLAPMVVPEITAQPVLLEDSSSSSSSSSEEDSDEESDQGDADVSFGDN